MTIHEEHDDIIVRLLRKDAERRKYIREYMKEYRMKKKRRNRLKRKLNNFRS